MLLIRNGKILTMTGVNYEYGFILIKGNKILEVGDNEDKIKMQKKHGELEIIDAKGMYVLPGFIDSHCHVGLWEDSVGFEGEDGNEMTDPVMPHLRAIDGIYNFDRGFRDAFENGVTTVVVGPGSANVIGGQFAALKTYGKDIDEMIIKEPVAIKVAFGENPKTVYNEKRQSPMTRMAIAAILRESLFQAKEYMELWGEYKKDKENLDKPEFDIKKEALVKVLEGEIPLKAHAHRADDIMTAIRIAKEFNINMTIEHATEAHLIKEQIAKEGIGVIVGPLLTDRSKIELKNQSLETPGILCKNKIKVAIMTDHPCTPIQYLALSASMAVREGMDEEDALKAITINAAELVGISEKIGSIEKGKDADIVIYDGHPLELRSRVNTTIINGQIVFKRGR